MSPARKPVAVACALAILGVLFATPALAFTPGPLEPRGKKVWFGVSDTGDPADFGAFSTATDKHPALIQSFRTWGSDFPDSIRRWQTARARPVLHITTADNNDGHELISPRGIAKGEGDRQTTCPSRPAAAERDRRRPPEGADRDRLESAPGRLADRPAQPPAPLLARLEVGRLGRHGLLCLLSRMGRPDQPLQPLRQEKAFRADRVGRRSRRRPVLRQQALRLGRQAPAHEDARLLPGLRQHQQLPDPELLG